jgi:hypothetical protein
MFILGLEHVKYMKEEVVDIVSRLFYLELYFHNTYLLQFCFNPIKHTSGPNLRRTRERVKRDARGQITCYLPVPHAEQWPTPASGCSTTSTEILLSRTPVMEM